MTNAGAVMVTARPRPTGWWGMMVFVASEVTLVGSIVGSYLYLRVTTSRWPPPGTPEPALVAPLVLAGVLGVSLLPLAGALGSARRGERLRALAFLALATLVQAAYLGVQIDLFVGNLAQFAPQQSAYASVYYVLLGADHFHVVVGLLLDAWLLARLAVRLTPYRLVALEAVVLYWAVVVGITFVVVATQLSPRV